MSVQLRHAVRSLTHFHMVQENSHKHNAFTQYATGNANYRRHYSSH